MITPDWPVPSQVKAYTLTHLDQTNHLPLPIAILQQVHGNRVVEWSEEDVPSCEPRTAWISDVQADGVYTTKLNIVCAVRTADCLPLLVTNSAGTEVAALHAGWRGLAAGIVEQGIAKFQAKPDELLVWLGPSICAQHYEIGEEVYRAFVEQDSALAECFTVTRPGHWQADINAIARMRLHKIGVERIFSSQQCTFENKSLYSYRRDAASAGRMIHCIWINKT